MASCCRILHIVFNKQNYVVKVTWQQNVKTFEYWIFTCSILHIMCSFYCHSKCCVYLYWFVCVNVSVCVCICAGGVSHLCLGWSVCKNETETLYSDVLHWSFWALPVVTHYMMWIVIYILYKFVHITFNTNHIIRAILLIFVYYHMYSYFFFTLSLEFCMCLSFYISFTSI